MVRAREKEDKTNQAREPDNETKKPNRGEQESRTTKQRKPDRATREPDNETKRAGQGARLLNTH